MFFMIYILNASHLSSVQSLYKGFCQKNVACYVCHSIYFNFSNIHEIVYSLSNRLEFE
jgi:hypothetical protein